MKICSPHTKGRAFEEESGKPEDLVHFLFVTVKASTPQKTLHTPAIPLACSGGDGKPGEAKRKEEAGLSAAIHGSLQLCKAFYM